MFYISNVSHIKLVLSMLLDGNPALTEAILHIHIDGLLVTDVHSAIANDVLDSMSNPSFLVSYVLQPVGIIDSKFSISLEFLFCFGIFALYIFIKEIFFLTYKNVSK